MKRSLLIYFAWISLVVSFLSSCSSPRVAVYSDDGAYQPFQEKMTFKAAVTWGEQEISGLLLVKSVENGNLKIAFMNELGMTYLEGKLVCSGKRKKLKVNNISPILDYKPFIQNFEKCIDEAFTFKPGTLWSVPEQVELHNGFRLNLTPKY